MKDIMARAAAKEGRDPTKILAQKIACFDRYCSYSAIILTKEFVAKNLFKLGIPQTRIKWIYTFWNTKWKCAVACHSCLKKGVIIFYDLSIKKQNGAAHKNPWPPPRNLGSDGSERREGEEEEEVERETLGNIGYKISPWPQQMYNWKCKHWGN